MATDNDDKRHDCGPWIETPQSSRVSSFRYDYANDSLQVQWRRGGAHVYLKVPQSEFRGFVVAGSKGRFVTAVLDCFEHRPATPQERNAPSHANRKDRQAAASSTD